MSRVFFTGKKYVLHVVPSPVYRPRRSTATGHRRRPGPRGAGAAPHRARMTARGHGWLMTMFHTQVGSHGIVPAAAPRVAAAPRQCAPQACQHV